MFELEKLKGQLAQMGIDAGDDTLALLDGYCAAVAEKNEVMNLTAITDPEGMAQKHVCDSLALASLPELSGRVADVGTGGGFPGVAIKIFRPELTLTLVDATKKKLDFVATATESLGIKLETAHFRAEEMGRKHEYRECFDTVVARAVANMRVLSELCLPLVKVGGWFLAQKGPNFASETDEAIDVICTLGGGAPEYFLYTLPDGDKRAVVKIRKISQTPTKYPRNSAKILANDTKKRK